MSSKPTVFKFELRDSGDMSVGIFPVREEVTIILHAGGWEKQDFEEDLQKALSSIFDMKCMNEREIEEENKMYQKMYEEQEATIIEAKLNMAIKFLKENCVCDSYNRPRGICVYCDQVTAIEEYEL